MFSDFTIFYSHQNEAQNPLVFKGGTCLSKVYTDFYRLSEDLDFVIPTSCESGRSLRRQKIDPVKNRFADIPRAIPGLRVSDPLQGHSASKQYIGYVSYESASFAEDEQVKIEIGLRENLICSHAMWEARSIIQNPFTRKEYLQPFVVHSIDFQEAYAEKIRAALTRREPAIRDFYDVYYASSKMGFDFHSDEFYSLVLQKLSVPGNGPIDVSEARRESLQRQVHTQLQTVLRPSDFAEFNLDMAFHIVLDIAGNLEETK